MVNNENVKIEAEKKQTCKSVAKEIARLNKKYNTMVDKRDEIEKGIAEIKSELVKKKKLYASLREQEIQKALAAEMFRKKELSDEQIAKIMQAIPQFISDVLEEKQSDPVTITSNTGTAAREINNERGAENDFGSKNESD